MKSFEIQPGVGVGSILLGSTRNEVLAALGNPESKEREEFEDGSVDEVWEYPADDLTLVFSSDDDWLLGTISIGHSSATLSELELIGVEESELLAALETLGVDELVLDQDFGDIDAKNYTWEARNVSFWVPYGFLAAISVMPIYDELDHASWPDRL